MRPSVAATAASRSSTPVSSTPSVKRRTTALAVVSGLLVRWASSTETVRQPAWRTSSDLAALALFYEVDRSTVTRAVNEIRPLLAARGLTGQRGELLLGNETEHARVLPHHADRAAEITPPVDVANSRPSSVVPNSSR
jgi:hypothetical protein